MTDGLPYYRRGFEHGEPGGAFGMPIPRYFVSEPVPFLDRHPLFNDPDANPYIPPYVNASDPQLIPPDLDWPVR